MNTLFKTCLVVLGLSLGGAAAYAATSHDVGDSFPAGVFAEDSASGPAVAQKQAPSTWNDEAFESDD